VTGVSAEGIRAARDNAYKAVEKIGIHGNAGIEGGFHYRNDIAHRALR
jgi:phosphoribosylamine-glycine ligase